MRNKIPIFIIHFLMINKFLDGFLVRDKEPFRKSAIIPPVTFTTKGEEVVAMKMIVD